jgi:hypothetical membrane protein
MRRGAWGGVVGPVVFLATWAIAGATTDGYSAVTDHISDLAAVHASTRVAMTTAFVALGIGTCLYAVALRSVLRGPAWIAAVVSGLATLGVAAAPLDHSKAVDKLHGAFAGAGYVTLALTALLAVAPLDGAWAKLAAACGTLCAVSLALSLGGPAQGLFQRAGITAGDVWIVASAVAIIRRRFWCPTVHDSRAA